MSDPGDLFAFAGYAAEDEAAADASAQAEYEYQAQAEETCELHNRYPCWSCMKDQPTLGAGS